MLKDTISEDGANNLLYYCGFWKLLLILWLRYSRFWFVVVPPMFALSEGDPKPPPPLLEKATPPP